MKASGGMSEMGQAPTMFRSAGGRERYFAAYEAMLARWPGPVDPIDVETRFGPTHINACGPADAPPLLLLPGAAFSSTMWFPNIASLKDHFRIYALDIIGDMGKSVLIGPKPPLSGYEAWLSDVLDGLGLQGSFLAGLSVGGYIAARLAIYAPERVRRLVLMSPAGFVPFRKRFWLALAGFLLPLPLPQRLKWILGGDSGHTVDVFRQAATRTDFRYQMLVPKKFTAEELVCIKAPTLLLMGDLDGVFSPQAVFARVQGWVKSIRCEQVRDAGHALSLDRPGRVNRALVEFLGGG